MIESANHNFLYFVARPYVSATPHSHHVTVYHHDPISIVYEYCDNESRGKVVQ